MIVLGAGRRPVIGRLAVVPWWGWILLLVLAEAVAIVVLLPTGWSAAVGKGDGAEYQRYAFNLLHHGVFSETPAAPYHPGVVRSPGYPAFLGALEWIGGRHAAVIQSAQFALLAATAILVGLIGRDVSGPAAGNLAAALTAVYVPLLGLATVFLTESLATFLVTAVVLLLVRARRAPGWGRYAAIGLVLAAAAYVRPETSLLAVPIFLVLLLDRRSPWRLRARAAAAAALAGAVLIAVVPWLVRNASVTGGRLVPMEADSGAALLASADQYDGRMSESGTNVKVWDGQVAKIVGVPAAASEGIQAPVINATARRQVAVNNQEQSAAVNALKAVSAGTVLAHLPRRVVGLWLVGDDTPPAGAGSWWHPLAQLEYVPLLVLALIGIVIRRRRLVADWPLWLTGAVLTLTHLVFAVEARYTVPARPALMIYAATGALAVASRLGRSRTLHR